MKGSGRMANIFQKYLYIFSSISPVGLIFSIVWFFQKKTILIPIVCISVFVVIDILFFVFFNYARKSLASINVNVIEVSSADLWIVSYLISYLVPLGSVMVDDWNIVVCGIVGVLICIAIALINESTPNPLLLFFKNHFYKIKTENGLEYTLISKRKIRNKESVKVVGRWFEYLLIEKRI